MSCPGQLKKITLVSKHLFGCSLSLELYIRASNIFTWALRDRVEMAVDEQGMLRPSFALQLCHNILDVPTSSIFKLILSLLVEHL